MIDQSPILNEGEELCSDCNGGKSKYNYEEGFYYLSSCSTCYGTGKLDWIEKIVGKKPINRTKLFTNSMYGMNTIRNQSLLNLNILA